MVNDPEYKIAQEALGYEPKFMATFWSNIKSPHRYMWHLGTVHTYRKNTKMKLKIIAAPEGKGRILKVLKV